MKTLPVCIDASLIIPTLVPHPLSQPAEQLLARCQRERLTLTAPTLLAFEVTSTLRGFVHLKAITPERGEQAITEFLQLPIRLSSRRGIFPLAFRLAQEFQRPRAYDTSYLALAQLLGCEFWTADERLYNVVKEKLDWVKWIGSVQPH